MKSSNIGGQAVMEGVMMMNKDRYSVAVRRPDGEIEVKVEQHKPLTKHKGLLKVPILRGVFSFADSMIVGMSSLMYSASFYEDEEEEKKKPATKEEEEQQKAKKEKTDRLMMSLADFLLGLQDWEETGMDADLCSGFVART